MKIITYNLRFGGKGCVHWKEIIDQHDPDVLLVQESYPPSDHLPDEVDAARAVWSPAAGKNGEMKRGSAVHFKRYEPQPIRLPQFHGWVVGAEIDDVFGKRVRFFSLHAPSGMGTYQRVVNQILDCLLDFRDGTELVIGGDFNLSIGERHESEELRTSTADLKIQNRLRDEFGLVNCWQAANPNQPLPQTLRWSNQPKIPYHCDGIFVPNPWADQLESCEVISGELWDRLRNHNPVLAEIN